MENKINRQQDRLLGPDILRILSMVLITLRHFISYSGLCDILGFTSVNGVIVHILDVLNGSAVNIFVLISGYFLVDSTFKWSRVLKIWGQTLFFSVVCFLCAWLCGVEQPTAGKILLSVLPVLTRHYWFPVAYLALYLASPFLNKMIEHLHEQAFTRLILGGAVILSAWTSVIYFSAGVLTGGNTGLLWFLYLYLVGAWVKKHPRSLDFGKKYIALIPLIVVLLAGYSFLAEKSTFVAQFPLLEDDSILELALSVLIFLVFLPIRGKGNTGHKIITSIAECSFGVYLIQESCMLRQWLWEDVVAPQNYADQWWLLPVACITVVSLFVAAWLGYQLYSGLFQLIAGKWLSKEKK